MISGSGGALETGSDARIEFLLGAIADIQGTIRAIDTKVGILLAALALPFRYAGDVLARFHVAQAAASAGGWIEIAALLAYATSALIAIRTVAGVHVSSGIVRGAERYNTFFAGGLYRFGLRDALVNRKDVASSMTLTEFTKAVPKGTSDVVADLSAEIMALAYIRDIKISRQNFAFISAGVAVVCALLRFAF